MILTNMYLKLHQQSQKQYSPGGEGMYLPLWDICPYGYLPLWVQLPVDAGDARRQDAGIRRHAAR